MKKNKFTKTYKRLAEIPLPHKARPTRDERFCLIVPPSPFVVPNGWEWVHSAPFEGPAIIATLVRGLGYHFSLIDQRDDFDVKKLKGKLTDFDIVGITTHEDSFPYIKKAVEIAKKEKSDRPVILGGTLVTSAPNIVMENTLADYAILGEGELTTIELLDFISGDKRAMPIEKIKGIAWRDKNGKIVINEPREPLENLDLVPFQDFSVWQRFEGKDIPEIFLSYSRGCAFDCSFCYRAFPKLRFKSVDRVRREIEYLAKRNFKMVWWNDLTFTINPEYVHELLNRAISRHDFHWCCFARAANVDLQLLKHMKKHGCNLLLYGFESITDEVLNGYTKRCNKNDILRAIDVTRKAKLKVGGLLIIGSPEETESSLNNVIKFARQFKEVTRVKYLSAIPGTRLYKDLVKKGFIKNELKHLYFLARERAMEDDEFLRLSRVSEKKLRAAYRAINEVIEKRPYEYEKEENVFLKKPVKFKKRT